MTAPEGDTAYERGLMAGRMLARLDAHDVHFALINGSLADMTEQLRVTSLAIQHLADVHKAHEIAEDARAEAVRQADESRRAAEADHWITPARVLAVLSTSASVVALIAAIILGIIAL